MILCPEDSLLRSLHQPHTYSNLLHRMQRPSQDTPGNPAENEGPVSVGPCFAKTLHGILVFFCRQKGLLTPFDSDVEHGETHDQRSHNSAGCPIVQHPFTSRRVLKGKVKVSATTAPGTSHTFACLIPAKCLR